jgi:hypothetical protein
MADGQMPEECCGKCRFWWREAADTYGDDDPIFGDEDFSQCRRFPKQHDSASRGFQFEYEPFYHPITLQSDWCGEFQPKEVQS